MKTVDELELWKCKNGIAVKQKSYKDDEYQRRIFIENDEIVEFRYHHSIHFRTIDDIYCVLPEDIFYENFEPYGKIFTDVKFANVCNLDDIIKLRLFHKELKSEPK